jgi:soluble lytic murein transglycosylase
MTLTPYPRWLTRLPLLCSLGLASHSALAEADIHSQRKAFREAQAALAAKQLSKARSLLPALANYPLKPYIEQPLLNEPLTSQAPLSDSALQAADAFIAEQDGSLPGTRLHRSLLIKLAKDGRWQRFLAHYDPSFTGQPLDCYAAEAKIRTGDEGDIAGALALWNQGKSLDAACNSLIGLLEDKQLITPDIRLSRLEKALENNNTSLATHLRHSLTGQARTLAESYFRLHAQPRGILQTAHFNAKQAATQRLIGFGIRRLAKQDVQAAYRQWQTVNRAKPFDATLAANTQQLLMRLLIQGQFTAEAEELLGTMPKPQSAALIEPLMRKRLAEQNWGSVSQLISQLSPSDQQQERWQYWYARSHEALNTPGIDTQTIFNNLALKRSWYGFLAADRLQLPYLMADTSTTSEAAIRQRLAKTPAFLRLAEWRALEKTREAKTEWFHTVKRLSKEEILVAAEISTDWSWYHPTIVALAGGELWDHIQLRFPVAHTAAIERAARKQALDVTYIFAITRQESAFAPDIVSSAGARGLMQLMPATAKEQAKHSGLPHNLADLFKPEHNIQLGAGYLKRMLTQFNNNRVLATAAYNAGPHRVKKWLATVDAPLSADIWAEIIPFTETRQYVQNVLTYAVIYDYRLQYPQGPATSSSPAAKLTGAGPAGAGTFKPRQPFLYPHERLIARL